MDIRVGDIITFKYLGNNTIHKQVITYEGFIKDLMNPAHYKILKIERPVYEVVEEKQELLTDEEREFLKDICKHYRNAKKIEFYDTYLSISDNRDYVLLNPDYPNNMKFENIEKQKQREYTLEELELEQQ